MKENKRKKGEIVWRGKSELERKRERDSTKNN